MRTNYHQICKNCGHPSTHHRPGLCLHDISYSKPASGMLVFSIGKEEKDMVACGCDRWDGTTVIDYTQGDYE